MTPAAEQSEFQLERRISWRAFLVALLFFSAIGVINAATLITDAGRSGAALDPRAAFILELSSVAVVLALFPLVALLERRFPLTPGNWFRTLAVYLLASLVFSALHVAGMILLREAAFALFLGQDYSFFDSYVWDSLYEYRKDLLSFAALLLVVSLMRRLEESRVEADAAREEARDTGRLTLKSGGRTVWLDAKSLDWAEAAGNYVEIRAGGKTHLARIGLSALAEQLEEAGIRIARVHRSRLVNRAKVLEVIPSGDGDYRIRMADGSELRGSRRYRELLD